MPFQFQCPEICCMLTCDYCLRIPRPTVDQLIRAGQLAPRAVVDETGAASQNTGVECPICFNVGAVVCVDC
jgi:hypothetical protein